MTVWIDRYFIQREMDKTKGEHYIVVSINNRGTKRAVARYKALASAEKVLEVLEAEKSREV